MKPSFSNLEVLKFALSLESGGIDFYEKFAEKAQGEVKELFLKLAADERKHAAYFQEVYDKSAASEEAYDYMFDETVNSFFDSYAKSEGFSREVGVVTTVKEAIKEAIVTETITVAFYEDLLTHSKGETVKTLELLIKEEENHRDLLSAMLNKA